MPGPFANHCHPFLSYNKTRLNDLLERVQIVLLNIQRPLQPHRWVDDCVLNHDSLYLHYDQLVCSYDWGTNENKLI